MAKTDARTDAKTRWSDSKAIATQRKNIKPIKPKKELHIMSFIEKFCNGVMLGVITFVFLAFTTFGVRQYVKATGHLAWAMSGGITLAMVYGIYLLTRWQLNK